MVSYTYRLSKRLMVFSGYNYIGNAANATYNFYVNRVKYWASEMDGFSLDLLNAFARPVQKPARLP